jgi:hypothetical protein
MSDGSKEWANVGVTRISLDSCHCAWVIFRRWNENDVNTDQFWDGAKWVGSPEEAIAHEDFSSGMSDVFQSHLNESMGDEATGPPEPAQRSRESLESQHGRVWNTPELLAEFEIVEFDAHLARVIRKSNGKNGSFVFQHYPRFFFLFIEERHAPSE